MGPTEVFIPTWVRGSLLWAAPTDGGDCMRVMAATRDLSILIVDDDPSIRDFLAFLLEDEGFRVSTASDGADALSKIAEDPPDVVLTDLMMPRMDGFELIRRLRAESQVGAIIAMSAVTANSGRVPDADAFLPKPFEIDHLLDRVQSLHAYRDGAPEHQHS